MSTTPPHYSSALHVLYYLYYLYSSYVSARLLYLYLYAPRHDAVLSTLLREACRVEEHLLLIPYIEPGRCHHPPLISRGEDANVETRSRVPSRNQRATHTEAGAAPLPLLTSLSLFVACVLTWSVSPSSLCTVQYPVAAYLLYNAYESKSSTSSVPVNEPVKWRKGHLQ